MTTEITDYVSVHQRAADLGCAIPQRIALLPSNFDTAKGKAELLQASEAATVRSLFRSNHLAMDELLQASERPRYIQNNDFEWIAPTLFIASALMSENPNAVALALNVLASYITDFFKGTPSNKTVKLYIVVERRGDLSCKKIKYEGDVNGLRSLPDIIKRVSDG